MKKFLLTTTGLTFAFSLAPSPAEAGPIIGAVVTWASGVLAAGGLGAALLKTAIGIGANLLLNAVFKPKTSKPMGVNMDVKMGENNPLTFIVGDYVTAGSRKYIGSWGRETRFITEVIEVSCLPQGFDSVWINDEKGVPAAAAKAWISSSGNVSSIRSWSEGASVPAGSIDMGRPYTNMSDDGNRITIKWVDGNQTAADPFLMRVFGSDPDYPWTSRMVGRGKAYAIVTTRYDDDTLTNYPTFLFKPAPLALYDIRKDSTNGGTGTHRWGQPATYEPTRNPAVIAYNVSRGIYWGTEWVFGGQNLPAWRLPSAEWIAAANACDALRGGEPSYRVGMEIEVDRDPADVLEEIAKSANMKLAETGGYIKPTVDLPASAVYSFDDDAIQISDGQTFQPHFILAETYNSIQATYPEPGEKWTLKDAPELKFQALIDADGGRYLPVPMSYPAVPYAKQVQRLMRAQIQDYRRFRRHTFHLPPDAYVLEPNDMVAWSSKRNGYNNKLFIVESIAKVPAMKVLVSLREVDPTDYDWSSDYEVPISIVTPVNPKPFTQVIEGFNVFPDSERSAAGQPRKPTIRCEAEGTEVGIERIHVQARVRGQTKVTHDVTFPWLAPFIWHIRDLIPVENYQVRARLISTRTPKSEWTGWLEVTTVPVVGVTAEDLADDIYDQMREIAKKVGITPVDTLPTQGEFPNQIIVKLPENRLYRWDANANNGAGGWSEDLYAGIPPGAIDETKFAQGIEPNKIIPAGQPLPTVKSTNNIVWNGALYTWDGTKYTAPSFSLTPGIVKETHIDNLAVSVGKIKDSAISAIKLANNAVTRDKILNGAVETLKLADLAITEAKIAVGAITDVKVNDGAITDAKIAGVAAGKLAGQVVQTQIADNAISSPKIVGGAVVAGKIGALAVETGKLAAGSVIGEKIEGLTITGEKIAGTTITGAKIVGGTIQAGHIASEAVTTAKLDAEAVTAAKIATDAVVARTIQAGAVGVDQLAAKAVVASKLAVSDWSNLIADDQMQDAASWSATSLPHVSLNPNYGVSNTSALSKGAVLVRSPAAPATTVTDVVSDAVPCNPGEEFLAEGIIAATGTIKARVWLQFLNKDPSDPTRVATNTAVPAWKTSAAFEKQTVSGVAAATARWVRIVYTVDVNGYAVNANAPDNHIVFANPVLRRKNGGELIVDGAIVAGKIAGLAVNTDKLAANAVTAGKIESDAIETRHLKTDAVTAAKIQAGAVGADQIAARAVIASKLAIADFTNLVPDDQIQDASSWLGGAAGVKVHYATTPRNDIRSVGALLYKHSANTARADHRFYTAGFFPVTPGDELFCSGQAIRQNGTRHRVIFQLIFYDKNDAGIPSPFRAFAEYNGTGNTAADFKGTLTVPAGALQARFGYYIYGADTETNGDVYLGSPTVRIKNKGELLVDGIITANKIDTDAVTSNAIAAGAISTTHLAAGAVTAAKIDVVSLSAISANLGLVTAGTIRSGTTGGRFQLDTSVGLRIWDDSGTLRVILGKIS